MVDYRQQAGSVMMHTQQDGDRKQLGRPSSRQQLGNNFSYPRQDGHPLRYYSGNNRSSVNSNGSLPGMTDSSDSEASVDDDYYYNTSGSELWDSFWSNGIDPAHRPQKSSKPATLRSQIPEPFSLEYYITTGTEAAEGDLGTGNQAGQDSTSTTISMWEPSPKTLPQQAKSQPPRSAVTYSIYPKPAPSPTRKTEQDLLFDSAKSPRHRKKLRSSVSAHNMRDRSDHKTTVRLAPVPAIPEQPRSAPPQIEHFVSTFDFDSENESEGEHRTFAKRIAHGLAHRRSLKDMSPRRNCLVKHQKSASEKSVPSPGEEGGSRHRWIKQLFTQAKGLIGTGVAHQKQ